MPPELPTPKTPSPEPKPLFEPPSPRQQSWGTIISLIIILLMIVVGALYAWGQRVAEQNALLEQFETETF
jgi:hypothetical protein